jgi:anionic cell wall polymer biosynthesis LytR-Cps2A-Psr (LCP) family protein
MVRGGPLLLVKTVEELVGVDIRYYFLTSFDGFRNMVNAVGGLDVEVPYAIGADHKIAPFAPGVQELDGDRALDFARNRIGTPNGDFTRSENQGLIVLAALQKFRQDMRRDPMTLFTWVASGLANIQTDLSAGEAFYLALASLSIEPGNVANRVTPGGLGLAGEASIVTLGSEADAVFADLRTDGLLKKS